MIALALLLASTDGAPDTTADLTCAAAFIRDGMTQPPEKDASDTQVGKLVAMNFFLGRLTALAPGRDWAKAAIEEARTMTSDRDSVQRAEIACLGRKAGLMLSKAESD